MGGMVGFGVGGGGGSVCIRSVGGQDLGNIYGQRGLNCNPVPLLSAPPRNEVGVEAWQQQQHHGSIALIPSRDLIPEEFIKEKAMIMEISSENKEDVEKNKGSLGLGLPSNTCQDCGNQAKKDCTHMRCRTCCKSRGFDCPTHVKSTWVPAAKRRERQQEEGRRRSNTKRQRSIALGAPPANATTTSHTSTSAATPPPLTSDMNSTQINHPGPNIKTSLPAEVRAHAVFKCVRVTAIEDGDDEYAYKTTVKIGGHIFKGVLYDRGLDTKTGPSNLPDLHLGERNVASTSALIDPARIYGAPGSAFLGALR